MVNLKPLYGGKQLLSGTQMVSGSGLDISSPKGLRQQILGKVENSYQSEKEALSRATSSGMFRRTGILVEMQNFLIGSDECLIE